MRVLIITDGSRSPDDSYISLAKKIGDSKEAFLDVRQYVPGKTEELLRAGKYDAVIMSPGFAEERLGKAHVSDIRQIRK